MKRRTVCLLFITFYVLISIIYLKEPLAAPYYEGKILKIIVGAAPGGVMIVLPGFSKTTSTNISLEILQSLSRICKEGPA